MGLAQLDRAFGYGPKGRGFESSNPREAMYQFSDTWLFFTNRLSVMPMCPELKIVTSSLYSSIYMAFLLRCYLSIL